MSFSIENAKALLDARKIMIPPPIRKRKRSPRHRSSISTISPPTATSPNTSSVAFSTVTTEDDEYIAQILIFLSRDPNSPATKVEKSPEKFTSRRVNEGKEGLFVYECKTCNKAFSSFQALGGHRASHKKPKLALEIKKAPQEIASTSGVVKSEDENNKSEIQGDGLALKEEPVIPSNGNGCNNKSRIHKCSICGAEFNSGQALGGHMRRHRPLNANVVIESSEANKDRDITAFDFDLNVPFETDEETLEARGLFCQANL